MHLPEEGRFLKDGWSVLLILPAIFLFLCSPSFLWAFVPDDLGFVISGQEGGGRTTPGGKTFTNSIGMTFVQIPAGTFMMGSSESESGRFIDEDQHRVTLTQPFYLQTTEVTQGQWKAVMGRNPSHFSNCGDNCPVEQVSWNDCREFIQKLNQKEGTNKYRLPTEAEWEYACRAGTTGPYYTDLDRAGWYSGNSGSSIHPVAQKAPNVWGLYDMHGNVWEWCSDWYGDYPNSAVADPGGPLDGSRRVFRGGSWSDTSKSCRLAHREWNGPSLRTVNLGFRLVSYIPDHLEPVIISEKEESEKASYSSSKKAMTTKKDNLSTKPLRLEKGFTNSIKAMTTKKDNLSTKPLRLEKGFTNSIGMNFVLIPAGSFVMGSPQGEQKGKTDEIQHAITLDKSFYMQETEVTFGQWKALMGDKLSKYNFCSDHPVEWVTWNECQEFIQKLNHREKTNKYRLPTEAEWEYACRAGTTTPFNTGKCLSSNQANYNGERRYKDCPIGSKASGTVPVKSFAPNAWGLYDMHGNVWEWCADLYIGHHRRTVIDLEAVSRGAFTVIRGGGSGSGAEECRSAYRSRTRPGYRYFYFGFRLVRDF